MEGAASNREFSFSKNGILLKRYDCIDNRSTCMFQSENLSLVFIDLLERSPNPFICGIKLKISFEFVTSSFLSM